MYKQVLTETGSISVNLILRTVDNAYIPNCVDNRDWINYQLWLSQGNTPDPA